MRSIQRTCRCGPDRIGPEALVGGERFAELGVDQIDGVPMIRAFSMKQRKQTPMSQCHHPMH